MTEDSYEKFYASWLDSSKKFMSAWQAGASSQEGGSAYAEPSSLLFQFGFFREAQSLFEKLMWFPPFSMIQGTAGPGFTQTKDYLELLDLYSQLYREWVSVYIDFSRALMTTIASANSKLMGAPPNAQPSEVYNTWIETMEGGVDALLRDQLFASKLAAVLSRMLDVRKKFNEIMESYYSAMNLPTKSEIDRIYKEMYLMKKTIRKLSSEKSKTDSS